MYLYILQHLTKVQALNLSKKLTNLVSINSLRTPLFNAIHINYVIGMVFVLLFYLIRMRNFCLKKCIRIPMRKSLPMIIKLMSKVQEDNTCFMELFFLAMESVSFVACNIGCIGIVSLLE